jgi:CHAT domain-containing protein
LSGQCPDKQFLWHRIIYLRDSTTVLPKEQLAELLRYLEEMKNCPYQNDSTHALLLQRTGWLFSTQKEFIKAINLTRESIGLIYNNLSKTSVNYYHVIKSYNNLRIFYDSIGQFRLAEQAMDSCIAIGLKLHRGYEYSLTLLPGRTYSYLESGDYYKCIQFSNLGEILSRSEAAYSHFLYYYIIWKINSFILLNKFNEAEELLKNTITEYLQSKDKVFLGVFYGLLARISEEKGDEKNALAYLDKCIHFNGLAKNQNGCAEALNNIGYNLYYKRLKKYDAALKYYNRALPYAGTPEALNIYDNIANIYVARGMFDSAFYFFQRAFDQLRPGINDRELLNHAGQYFTDNFTEYIANLLLDKCDAYLVFYGKNEEEKNLKQAIASYKVIDKIFDTVRYTQSEIQSKLFWRNSIRRLYENAIAACYLQHNIADALYFFEKSRAVLLQDQLNEQHWAGENDILKQTQIKRKIQQLERQLDEANKSGVQSSELQAELFTSKQELRQTGEVIRTGNPFYYQNFIGVKDVQGSILKDHQALVELFSGDSAVYILVITHQQFYLKKINKPDFDRLSDAYLNFVSNPELLNRNFNAFENLSLQLYQLIFQDISLPKGRIIISPDGKYFPFEALITNIKPLSYFLDDHAVSYTYSGRYLLNQFTPKAVSNSNIFMGIAPVHYTNGFSALLGSDESLREVQSYFSDPVNLTGSDASRNNFLKQYYKYKIIQLYTHATDNGYSGEPMIYFSDSALLLSDLFYETKPVTSLIVLSACETAQGKLYTGEGIFSFSRQFAALGIPSSVSNLWQANDQSTYKITELFYRYLSKGMTLDVALQKAKKDFRSVSSKEKNLPYYWAASILVGQTESMSVQKGFPRTWIITIALILLVGFAALKIGRQRTFKRSNPSWR